MEKVPRSFALPIQPGAGGAIQIERDRPSKRTGKNWGRRGGDLESKEPTGPHTKAKTREPCCN